MKKFFLTMLFIIGILIKTCYGAEVTIRMLDVGQGDAILIQTEEENVLIDTGDSKERKKLYAGLTKAGAYKIDKLILTHPHADHIGNAAWLLENKIFKVVSVYDSGVVTGSLHFRNYRLKINQYKIPYKHLTKGDTVDLGNEIKLLILYPAKENLATNNLNNTSIVIKLVAENISALFTGDLEASGEKELLTEDIKADILKVGHHGAKTSSSVIFLQKVLPKIALISAGYNNKYKHPHKSTIDNLLRAGVEKNSIFCTADCGEVVVKISDSRLVVERRETTKDIINADLGNCRERFTSR